MRPPTSAAPKVESAAEAIGRLNPHVRVEGHAVRLTAANALDLVSRYDLVADGSDNFATRYLVSDACYLAKRPLVTAAVGVFDATLTTIRAHERDRDGSPIPPIAACFRSRRLRAPCRPAPRPASSARSPASSAR